MFASPQYFPFLTDMNLNSLNFRRIFLTNRFPYRDLKCMYSPCLCISALQILTVLQHSIWSDSLSELGFLECSVCHGLNLMNWVYLGFLTRNEKMRLLHEMVLNAKCIALSKSLSWRCFILKMPNKIRKNHSSWAHTMTSTGFLTIRTYFFSWLCCKCLCLPGF